MGEQPVEGHQGHLVQALALGHEPVLERGLLDCQSLEEVALVERGGLGQRGRCRLRSQPLELAHVHGHRGGIAGHHLAIDSERLAGRPAQALPERVQRVAEARARRGLHRAPPEETRQLVARVGPAGRHRQVGQESLGLPGGEGEGYAGIEAGSKAAQERQREPRHRVTHSRRLTIARLSRTGHRRLGYGRPCPARRAQLFTRTSTDRSHPNLYKRYGPRVGPLR